MFEEILVPTDGSPAVEAALDEAMGVAELAGARVHALYVIDTRDYNVLPESKWLSLEDELEAEGLAAVERVADRAREGGLEASTAVERGIPHKAILQYAEVHSIDLIVMATHGRSGVDRFLLGSVTEKAIRRSDVPVLVVRYEG
mgnify:CR=1 FL=1